MLILECVIDVVGSLCIVIEVWLLMDMVVLLM